MKKLINTCRAIQTLSAVAVLLAIALMASAYDASIKQFLIMGVVFVTGVMIYAVMALIISIATEIKLKHEKKTRKAVFCNYSPEYGMRLYVRGEKFESR